MGKLTVGSNPTVSAIDAPARAWAGASTVPGGRYRSAVPRPPSSPPGPEHDAWMDRALEPPGPLRRPARCRSAAVVVRDPEGEAEVVAIRHNEREATGDPTAHAEVLALRDAASALGRWRLDDCLMVVTLEPCPMCAGALWAARVGAVVFGAENSDAGALGTLYHLGQDPRLNHEFPVRAGVRRDECTELLVTFFADRR